MIDERFFQLEDILEINDSSKMNMVDITVEDDETFVLSNGILSHNSAKSMISAVRDPEIHGALPLRGKILNVFGESLKDISENQIITDIMQSIGLKLGVKAVRSELRYGRIYLATDQDPDGANIAALLVNFFYSQWPELFQDKENPFVYAFQTPFIIQKMKNGDRKYWYADDHQNFDSNNFKGHPHAIRAKGLGSLEEEDWIHALEKPKVIPIVDDGKLMEALDLIFNDRKADARKDWISI